MRKHKKRRNRFYDKMTEEQIIEELNQLVFEFKKKEPGADAKICVSEDIWVSGFLGSKYILFEQFQNPRFLGLPFEIVPGIGILCVKNADYDFLQ